jgi:Ca2+-binding RTX toxin-like protein
MATLSFKPSLNLLEDRCVPAAFTFNQGTLTINMAEISNRTVNVSANAGRLIIQGRQAGGSNNYVVGAPAGRLDLYALNGIVVNGSNQRDIINLSGVDTQFNNLNGRVFIYGNSGDDIINGTQFDDTIDSGSGNDRVFGLAGNDVIFGKDGNDTIWGDGNSSFWDRNGGNDTIYCGSGNDYAYGGGGDDNLIGDGGQDIFNGGVGFDTAFIDSLDVVPRNGWQSVGIEIVRR